MEILNILFDKTFTFVLFVFYIKGDQKNLTDQILFSLYLKFWWSDLQNLGVYPHNTPLIMGDWHTNFEDKSKTKFDLLGFFVSPFTSSQ
jgi:hypothetical protein